MGDLQKDWKMDCGLDVREFGGLKVRFRRARDSEKKVGYLVTGWANNEGMRNHIGTFFFLPTW